MTLPTTAFHKRCAPTHAELTAAAAAGASSNGGSDAVTLQQLQQQLEEANAELDQLRGCAAAGEAAAQKLRAAMDELAEAQQRAEVGAVIFGFS